MPTFPDGFLVSIIVPIFNEQSTLRQIVAQIRQTELPLEIILVNDGSTDGSAAICEAISTAMDVHWITHATNQGKGAALRSGFLQSTGDVVVVQDADLEYDPADLWTLLEPILNQTADVVYGSRFYRQADRDADGWHYWANGCITWLSNRFTGWRLTDVETCYKVIRRPFIEKISPQLCENRFGIEIELTARLAAAGARVVELPITYQPRSRKDGKKISWIDGIWALWCVLRYAAVTAR